MEAPPSEVTPILEPSVPVALAGHEILIPGTRTPRPVTAAAGRSPRPGGAPLLGTAGHDPCCLWFFKSPWHDARRRWPAFRDLFFLSARADPGAARAHAARDLRHGCPRHARAPWACARGVGALRSARLVRNPRPRESVRARAARRRLRSARARRSACAMRAARCARTHSVGALSLIHI